MNILYITGNLSRDYKYTEDSRFEPSFDIIPHVGGFDEDITETITLLKSPYVPTKGDKIYFLPAVNVPRIKFKNVCVEHGIKNVRDVTQANIIFGSKKSLYEMTTSHWAYKCSVKDFLSFVEIIKDKMDDYDLEKIETALEFYTNEYLALDYNTMSCVYSHVPDVPEETKYSDKMVVVKSDYKDLFLDIINKLILDESSVINVLNGEDAAEIDKVMFEHISEMFDSSDNDNHVLAMEIMANSKYVESLIYLELLFYKYSGKISSTNTKNHVNFKSLVSYLGKDKNYLGTDIDDVVNSLRDKDQLTPDKLDILLSHTSKDIQQSGDSRYFTVKTVSVKPEVLAELNSNYSYELQEDFVPTVAETPVVKEVVKEIPVQVEAIAEEPESEFAAEDNFEEEVEWPVEEPIFTEEQEEEIEEAFARLERKELKSELIALEEQQVTPEPVSNNNQIETNGTDDFGWF